jgi:hypothetical protein
VSEPAVHVTTAVTTTVFRQAVAAHLADALGIRFVDGPLEGPIEKRDLACTYPVQEDENPDNTIEEVVTIGVRVFQAYVTQRAPESPIDPSKLEAWAWLAKLTLAHPWGDLGVWYARVTRTEYDMEQQGFDMTIIGWQENPQAVA